MVATPTADRATSRLRSDSLFSESDFEDLAATNLQLVQWGAKLRAGAMRSLVTVPEATVSEAGQPILEAPERAHDSGIFASTAALAMRRWFVASENATSPCGVVVPASAGSSRPPAEEVVSGVVMIRGNFDRCLEALREALHQSLAEVLASAAGPSPSISVAIGKRAIRADLGTSLTSQAWTEFEFEVFLTDPNDRAPTLELLLLEAESGGALRLLPTLANSAPEVAGHLAVRLEIMS